MQLVDDTGFEPIDAGVLAESWRQQPGTPAYCTELSQEDLGPGALGGWKGQGTSSASLTVPSHDSYSVCAGRPRRGIGKHGHVAAMNSPRCDGGQDGVAGPDDRLQRAMDTTTSAHAGT
jgi:hypothetical protein